jgi:hypothetical protein
LAKAKAVPWERQRMCLAYFKSKHYCQVSLKLMLCCWWCTCCSGGI